MFSLEGKIAIITGASQGIGETIAIRLAEQGALAVCASLPSTKSDLQRVVSTIKNNGYEADYITLDMSNGDTIRSAINTVIERYGTVHILVNNAGITKDKLMLQMKEEEFQLVMDVNLKGSWIATQAIVRPMMKQRLGRIINIASIVGQIGNIGQSNYVASKAGIIGLTKAVAREFASRNITCNAVAPGYIATAMTDSLSETVKAEFINKIPLGRMGSATDIANTVVFLASDEASYITGQVISVNGGMLMP
jgi:3-oxoacyl-[acyl-carrier protein] reductase